MKKILLITPPYHSGVVEVAGRWMPLGLIYIAGELKKFGFKTEIYDAMTKNHDLLDIKSKIVESEPDVVGIGAYTSTINASLEVLKVVKQVNKEILTVLGGVHPSFCYEELFDKYSDIIDFIIIGEGEYVFPKLLASAYNGADYSKIDGIVYKKGNSVVINKRKCLIDNLDVLIPAWDLIDWNDYTYYLFNGSKLAVVSSSRGCDNSCSFCSQQKFWEKTWRARTPKNFVEEIKMLSKNFGVNVFLIADEFPTKDAKRWNEILNLIIDAKLSVYFLMETRVEDIIRDRNIMRKYKDAGIIHIYVGVESVNQETLDWFKKDIKVKESQEAIKIINETGIISETSFVLGIPDENNESIVKTLELANYYNPDFAHFLMLAPWPYSDIYNELKPYIETNDYSKYNLVDPVICSKYLTGEELLKSAVECYRKFYMRKVKEWISINDLFKKEYLLKSMKLIMKSSFLTKHLKMFNKNDLEVKIN